MRALARTPERWLWTLILLFVATQIAFSFNTRPLRAAIDEMPPPPTDRALKAMAFGDDEFLFRHLGRWLEYVGDGGGRVRPLREYDYDRVVGWLETLDKYDQDRSDYIHTLAAQYFGQVYIDPNRVRMILAYLRQAGLKDPVHNWKWLIWSAHTANKPLKDKALLAAIAKDLQSPELKNPAVPAWVRLLPIRLYVRAGDEAGARDALAKADPADIAAVAAQIRQIRQMESDARRRATKSEPIPDDLTDLPR